MNWIVFISEQWMLIALLIALLGAVLYVESRRSGGSMPIHQVTRALNESTAILVDVRDNKEFKAGHITGALNIPYLKLNERVGELEKHRSKTIVVVDKMGQHAGAACRSLKEKGFTVTKLSGGVAEWQAQNLPLVKG